MDVINSIKKIIFNNKDDNSEKNVSKNENENKKEEKKIREDDNHINYYKYLFKSNYKRKKSNKTNNININNNLTFDIYKQKQKEEFSTEQKIKVNKCAKNEKTQFNKNKLNISENININANTSFFYILKGAIFIIEDWWKKILIHNINNKNIIKRNINSKNYQIFSKKYIKIKLKNNSKTPMNINLINNNNTKTKPINKNKEKMSNIIIYSKNIENNKKNMMKNNNNNDKKDKNKNKKKKIIYKSVNINDIKMKKKLNELFENNKSDNQNPKDSYSYLEDTVINSDSGYYEFTTDNKNNDSEIINKEKMKINKIIEFDEEIRKRKIYSSDKINNTKKNTLKESNDNMDTKRENSIIYPMNEIEHLILEDMCSNLDNHVKKNLEKEKKIIEKYEKFEKNKNFLKKKNNKKCGNESGVDTNKINMPWEDPNNNMTPFISIEQNNNELFNEIKAKIKVNLKKINDEYESEEVSIIQNKKLLRENPLNDSSIYLRNSDIKQNELIRNVNIHIIPTKTKKNNNAKNYKSKLLNNSNNSNTIQLEDEEYGFSELINISDSKNDGHMSSFFNSVNKNRDTENEKGKNDTKRKIKEDFEMLNLKKYENIYKN